MARRGASTWAEGLCPPGRWPPEARSVDPSGFAKSTRVRLLKILCAVDYWLILAKLAANKGREC
eukprot:5628677-Heterocapsa_arctica.AAC.1